MLYAANGIIIKTFGIKTLVLDLGLRRAFRWTFLIADVRQPIIGTDFLVHFKLIINLSARKLCDDITKLNVFTGIVTSNQ